MYAASREHPLRGPTVKVLELAARSPRAFFTDAETLQELLHRYRSTRAWALGEAVFANFSALMRGSIEPILVRDVISAAAMADSLPTLDARDLLHLAVMQRAGADTLVSTDRAFDRVPGIRRLDPAAVDIWLSEVGGRR